MLCVHFLGNLSSSIGSKLCFEVEKCVDLYSFIDDLLRSKGGALSVEEVLVTSLDGKPLDSRVSTCDVSDVVVLRLVRGG
ncbi:MAG: hypothetical protein QXT76_00890 [Sulfolobales archaeon]